MSGSRRPAWMSEGRSARARWSGGSSGRTREGGRSEGTGRTAAQRAACSDSCRTGRPSRDAGRVALCLGRELRAQESGSCAREPRRSRHRVGTSRPACSLVLAAVDRFVRLHRREERARLRSSTTLVAQSCSTPRSPLSSLALAHSPRMPPFIDYTSRTTSAKTQRRSMDAASPPASDAEPSTDASSPPPHSTSPTSHDPSPAPADTASSASRPHSTQKRSQPAPEAQREGDDGTSGDVVVGRRASVSSRRTTRSARAQRVDEVRPSLSLFLGNAPNLTRRSRARRSRTTTTSRRPSSPRARPSPRASSRAASRALAVPRASTRARPRRPTATATATAPSRSTRRARASCAASRTARTTPRPCRRRPHRRRPSRRTRTRRATASARGRR